MSNPSPEDRQYIRELQCDFKNNIPWVCCNNATIAKLLEAPNCGINGATNRIHGGKVSKQTFFVNNF